MDLGLKGKVAMVAAGTKGIGLATAKALAAEGALVSICGRTPELFESALAEIGHGAKAFQTDVTKLDQLASWHAETVAAFGSVSILVTNTGGPPAGNWTAMSDEQWQAGFDSTLMNVNRMMRLVVPSMREHQWGRIVHITSLVAKEPNPLLPISSTLRAGIMALTKLHAVELAADGITVNGVLPGHTLTDRQLHLAHVRAERDGTTPEEALAKQASEVPMRRLAEPGEIGSVIAFLCSKQAAYLTGTSTVVDGGLVSGLL